MIDGVPNNRAVFIYTTAVVICICLVSFMMGQYTLSDISENKADRNSITSVSNSDSFSNDLRQKEQRYQTIKKHKSLRLQQCEQHCLALISKFAIGDKLSAHNLIFIIDNAAIVADVLKNQPEAMARMLIALQDDESSKINVHDAAYAIIDALSVHEKTQIASLISLSKNSSDRISALKLLQEGIETNEQAMDTFVSILTNENDPAVQISAINMVRQMYGEDNHRKLRGVLNNVIESNASDYIRGEALLAKISISPSSSFVAHDIYSLVSSFSIDLQSYGLQALEASMERYNAQFDAGNGWQEGKLIQKSIEAIAQDRHINTVHRNKAQELLERFF